MNIQILFISSLIILILWVWWYLFTNQEKPVIGIFPKKWKAVLRQKVVYYNKLSSSEKVRFEQGILQFFHDVKITGVGIKIDDTDRLLVASSAMIPLFGFPGWRYKNLHEVLLYEGRFNHDFETEGEDRNVLGMVGSGAMNRIMILSLPALYRGFENEDGKSNVGIHEFVHLLDKADGSTDGIPKILLQQQFIIPWLKRMHSEIQDMRNNHSDINIYGATNKAEFLSVVSEYFFTQPHLLEKKHPELFFLLEKLYRQDLN